MHHDFKPRAAVILWFLLAILMLIFILARQTTLPSSRLNQANYLPDLKDIENISVYKVMTSLGDGDKKVVLDESDKSLICNTINEAIETIQNDFDHQIQYGAGYLLFEFKLYDGNTSYLVVSNKVKNEDGVEVVLLSNGFDAYTVEWNAFADLWEKLNYPSIRCESADIPVL